MWRWMAWGLFRKEKWGFLKKQCSSKCIQNWLLVVIALPRISSGWFYGWHNIYSLLNSEDNVPCEMQNDDAQNRGILVLDRLAFKTEKSWKRLCYFFSFCIRLCGTSKLLQASCCSILQALKKASKALPKRTDVGKSWYYSLFQIDTWKNPRMGHFFRQSFKMYTNPRTKALFCHLQINVKTWGIYSRKIE